MENLMPMFNDFDSEFDEELRTHELRENVSSKCAPLKGNSRDFPGSAFQALKEILEKSQKGGK